MLRDHRHGSRPALFVSRESFTGGKSWQADISVRGVLHRRGSVLGPLLFTAFISPVSNVAAHHSVQQHQYADDTVVYVSMSKSDEAQRVEDLQRCLQSLHEWFAQNGLALNPDKTDVVSICPIWQHRTETADDGINVAGINIKPADQLKSLGVILDHRLNFVPHVKNVCRNSFYHIRALRHI